MAGELISYEPATGAALWRGPVGDVDTEVAIARDNWADWAGRSLGFRVESLNRFANVVRGRMDALIETISRETGKPLWEARTEVESVIAKVEISVNAYNERTAQRRVEGAMGQRTALRHKPHGVLAVLGPYNFPMHLANGHIVPALIAGNAVVFKPSEKTPASGVALIDCFHAAGIPTGVVRCVIGGPEEGKALAAHPDIDGLLFTGSARTGLALNRQYADMPNKILALEMGGNNPIVVWDAPDPYTSAVIIAQSAFLSAGQRCTAARRLIVQDGKHEQLILNLALLMKGGVPIVQMERPLENRPFLHPSLIDVTDVKDRPDIELFGPMLQLIRVPDFDAALVEANNTRYGLSASLVGGSPQLYDRFWANSRAGIVNWNKPTNGASSAAPFGGIGLSGNHRPSAYYAADYCAYPVVSSEEENARGSIGIGLRQD
jgi:succinylglutamic semialdehyde dehydrogenase